MKQKAALPTSKFLFETADWDFDRLRRTYDAISDIALNEFGLSVYPNQIEVITAEQMLDAYCSIGMPLMYKHWSFGKRFAQDEVLYRKGMRGLAYEIVINSSPCICYIMEENTMAMQTLVMAHAAFGHNHFFKNNSLFKQWTEADAILDYMEFSKDFIAQCEERHGIRSVERVLDAAHALMGQGINRYPRKRPFDLRDEQKREAERRQWHEQNFNDLWRTVPKPANSGNIIDDTMERKQRLGLPEENVLYFLEKTAPKLQTWQREVLRIVRNISQYFYPQSQTKVMNEGCATEVHYHIANRLHEKGMINDGTLLEILHSHTSVIFQPEFDDRRYSGHNPYALGFNMMEDIRRICVNPTAEDRAWFPDFAGNQDPWGTLKDAWANYRDESFILQYLSPELIRKMKLFTLGDVETNDFLEVSAIHNERGYRDVRHSLARQFDVAHIQPDIQVIDVDLSGDRRLIVQHRVVNGILLDDQTAKQSIVYMANLWGYEVCLQEVDAVTDVILREYDPVEPVLDLGEMG